MLFEALAKFGLPSESELFCGQVKDPLHTVAASITYGCSLHCVRLQAWSGLESLSITHIPPGSPRFLASALFMLRMPRRARTPD